MDATIPLWAALLIIGIFMMIVPYVHKMLEDRRREQAKLERIKRVLNNYSIAITGKPYDEHGNK